MKTTVRFEFNNASFIPRDYIGPRCVKLIDPTIVPATGDIVHLRIEEFFDDADLIRNFEDQSEGIVYYAERLNTIIGKTEIEVIVLLYEEQTFKESFPRFFSVELTN